MIPAALLVVICSVADRPSVSFGGHPLRVGDATVAISADGQQIIALSTAGVLRTFSAAGRLIAEDAIDAPVRNITTPRRPILSRTGTTAALVDSTSGEVYVSRAAAKREWATLAERRTIAEFAAVSGDGATLAVGFRHDIGANHLRMTREQNGTTRPLAAIGGTMRAVAVSQEGDWIVTLAADLPGGKNLLKAQPIQLLDVATAKPVWQRPEPFRHAVITADDRHIVLTGGPKDRPNLIVDLPDGEPTRGRKMPTFDILGPPVVSADGETLFAATADAVVVWNLATSREKLRLPVKAIETDSPRMAVSPDGTFLVTNFDGLRKWDTSTGRELFGPPAPVGHTSPIRAMRFHPNGHEVATLATDGTFVRWEVATGSVLERRTGLVGNELRFGPHGWRVARLNTADDGPLQLFDPRTGQSVVRMDWAKHIDASSCRFVQHCLTADGETAMSVIANTRKLDIQLVRWKPATGELLTREQLADGKVGNWLTAVSPSGRWSLHGWGIRHVPSGLVWMAQTDVPLQRGMFGNSFAAPSRMTDHLLTVNYSTAGFGSTVPHQPTHDGRSGYLCVVLEIASGRPIFEDTLDNDHGLVIAPDHRTLLRVRPNRLQFLDLTTGFPLAADLPLLELTGPIVYSPEGRLLAVGRADGSLALHAMPPREVSRLYPAIDDVWASLADPDPRRGRKMIEPLVYHSADALALFEKKLPLMSPLKDTDIPALVAKLDAPAFADRDAATRALRALGRLAKADLEAALQATESVELRQRVEDLLKALADHSRFTPTPEATRIIRTVEVLERIGTPAAVTMLEKLTVQTRDERMREEATAAVARLKLRDVKP